MIPPFLRRKYANKQSRNINFFRGRRKNRSGEGFRRGNSPEMRWFGSTADLWWHRVRMEHFHWHFSLLSFVKRALRLSLRFRTFTNGERFAFNARPRRLAVFLNFSDDVSTKGQSARLYNRSSAAQPTVCTHVTLPHRCTAARPERPLSPLIGHEVKRRGTK